MTEREPNAEEVLSTLSAQFSALTDAVARKRVEPPDAARVVEVAVRAIPHCAYAGLTLFRPDGPPVTVASSGKLPREVDTLQYATGQGPCLDPAVGDDLIHTAELIGEPRWPRFAARAVADAGVRSMFSVRVLLDGSDRGALSFYAERPGAFTDLDLAIGATFSSFASVALRAAAYSDRAGNLEQALTSSRQIAMAIGVLMGRDLLTEEEAFARLRAASQHLNRKLRDIAVEVVETGTVPEHE